VDWPEFFPDGCPREPYACHPGRYIRLVSTRESPPDEDFTPQISNRSDIRPKEGPTSICKRCALSVFNSREAAQDFLDNAGGDFRYPYMAWMEVSDRDGVIHPDESQHPGHFLWWIPRDDGSRCYREFFRGCVNDA
jgi:hypothetical protein